ncbi:hypothetical protein A3749_11390, partial [Oleiphilus sp. HI0078]
GSSIIIWLSYLPLMLLGSIALVYYVSTIDTNQEVESVTLLLVAILMAINSVLLGLQRFPEGLLNGSNIGYKSTFFRLVLLILSGVFSYLAILQGFGLIGLAVVQLSTTVLLFLAYFVLVIRNLNWLGFRKPENLFLKQMYRNSFWFFLWSIVNFALLQLEVLMLGIFSTVENVGKFAITYFAIQLVTALIATVIAAVLPGVGALIGKGKNSLVRKIRIESALYCWWLGLSLSVVIIVVNQSFVSVWVGADVFAGQLESFLIAILAFQLVILKNDSLLINLALEQREKVKVTLYGIALVCFMSAFLIPLYGIVGACISGIAGRVILLFLYPRIINSFLGSSRENIYGGRIILTSVLLFISSYFIAGFIEISSWIGLIFVSGIGFIIALIVSYLLGFSKDHRFLLKERMASVSSAFGIVT